MAAYIRQTSIVFIQVLETVLVTLFVLLLRTCHYIAKKMGGTVDRVVIVNTSRPIFKLIIICVWKMANYAICTGLNSIVDVHSAVLICNVTGSKAPLKRAITALYKFEYCYYS